MFVNETVKTYYRCLRANAVAGRPRTACASADTRWSSAGRYWMRCATAGGFGRPAGAKVRGEMRSSRRADRENHRAANETKGLRGMDSYSNSNQAFKKECSGMLFANGT